MSRIDAVDQIKKRIRGCFGHVDLKFALHPSDQARARELKKIARENNLSKYDIEAAIRPVIMAWLESGYCGFGENTCRPFSADPGIRESKALEMISAAANYIGV